MNVYKARDLLQMSYTDLWNMPSEWHKIIFDDGEELITKDRLTKLSVLYWNPFKHYDAPITKEHHLGKVAGERISSNKLQQTLNRVIWDIHTHSNETIDTEHLAKLAIETQNILYNQVIQVLGSFETTLDLVSLHEIYTHEKIRKANDELVPTSHGIEKVAYEQILEVAYDKEELKGNVVMEGIKSGTQRTDNFLQGFGPRGFPTDIDSSIFPEAITKGYISGIWDLYGNMAESRSGTKALLYNKELLKDTEYFNRKVQLIAQYVARLHHGDCKGHLIEFPIIKSTLKSMKGVYYLNDLTGKLEWLNGDEKHLIGKTVKIRNVLGCIHPDPQGVCSTCYGRLSFSIPHGANIGQVAAVAMGDIITSSVLATKHTDSTAEVEQYQMGKLEVKYLEEGKLEETLYLKQKTINYPECKLLVRRTEAQNLADILMIKDITNYPIENASELTNILIQYKDSDGDDVADMLSVSLYNRKASFSIEFLKFLKEAGWEIDDRDNIVIDLNKYKSKKPFLTLPNKHVNMYEVMKRIQSFMHSEAPNRRIRTDIKTVGFVAQSYLRNHKDPVDGLISTVNLLNEKFSINMAHCSVLVYAMMCRINPVKDYRLPKPGLSGGFEKYNTLMYGRSLGGMMAYENQQEVFNRPASFNIERRNDHPYDITLLGGRMD